MTMESNTTTDEIVVHENENYEVLVVEVDDNALYQLVNKETGVVESEGQSLPVIISEAEQANAYLEHKLWEWISSQAEQQRVAQSPLTVGAQQSSKKSH